VGRRDRGFVPNERDILFQKRRIHDDHFLFLALRERPAPLLTAILI